MTRHNITFHLPACSVAEGVQRRDSASIAADALREISARPLLSAAQQQQEQHRCPNPAACRLSMRFHEPTTAAAPPLQPFTFGSVLAGASAIVDVAHYWQQRILPKPQLTPGTEVQCQEVDQYSVPPRCPDDPEHVSAGLCARLFELFHGVLISNRRPGRPNERVFYSPLIGPTGHYERFSAWSHIVGFVGFLAFGVVRICVPSWNSNVQGVLTSVAAWATAFVFFSSSVYHVTAPDMKIAMFTRFLDFAAIYLGIVLSATADIAVATRGFDDVPIVTIIDLPVAGLIIVLFFLWRRHRLESVETWGEFDRPSTSLEPELRCAIGRGLFNRGHEDLHHSQLRSATSLLLTASYFMSVPAAVMTLDESVSWLVLTLQALAFVTIVGGMTLDRIVNWPNNELAQGKHECLTCPGQGCALTAHGLWHLIAILSTLLTVAAREYAVQSY